MNPSTLRRRGLVLIAVTVLTVLGMTPLPAHAERTATVRSVYATTDQLAHELAAVMRDRTQRDRVVAAVSNGSVDLATIGLGASFARSVQAANQAVSVAKGLPGGVSLLQVRLADPSMRISVAPLVAATPTDDEATALVGYDVAGQVVRIDAARVPARPVLLVEVDTAKALPLGIDVVEQRLGGHNAAAVATTTGYWATKVDAVRLSDDEEPWFKGAAEIYSIVGGFGLDGTANVDIVQMPYLDDDGQDYYPGQILVDWSHFRYNAVDAVMMEEDDGTNYRALAQAIATALLTILDGVQYAPMVNAILEAIPDSWWTDDPDYVDSWYVLTRQTNERRTGARGNGTISFQPYFVTTV